MKAFELTRRMKRESLDNPLPFRSPSSIEIAWAAGFIEGEGSFSFSSGHPRIYVCQVNPEPLLKLQSIFGGRIYKKIKHKLPNAKPCNYWRVCSYRARLVCYLVFPLLSKKRQAQARRRQCA